MPLIIEAEPVQAGCTIAIPARNEADRILPALRALSAQRGAAPPDVVVLLNNCTDASEEVVSRFACESDLRVHPVIRRLSSDEASAGVARALAMEYAAARTASNGALLTTDADSVAPPDWLAANLAALRRADAVAGRAVIDPVDAKVIPAALHEDDARECAYALLLDQIASLIDPDPFDPWPRHDEHSGASIAVRAVTYRRAGGMPAIPLGEDRAFFTALRRIDARVRHAPEVWVTVSGRVEGRAAGGMADTIRRRMVRQDPEIDDRLESAADAVRRARLRRFAREVNTMPPSASAAAATAMLAAGLHLPTETVRHLIHGVAFGELWTVLEAASPVLGRRRRVALSDLSAETREAARVRERLLRNPMPSLLAISAGIADPADTRTAATSVPGSAPARMSG